MMMMTMMKMTIVTMNAGWWRSRIKYTSNYSLNDCLPRLLKHTGNTQSRPRARRLSER